MGSKAFVYTRMSSPEQLLGDSLRRQFSAAVKYAERRNLELIPIADHGVSAFRGANAQLGKLADFLTQVKNAKIPPGSFFIVESLDRISRDNVGRAIPLLLDIINGGVTVVTLFDDKEYSAASIADGPMSLMMALISFATAGEESRKKSLRLKAVWGEKKQASRESGLPATSVTPGWIELGPDGKTFVEIERRVTLVREVFRLATSGFGSSSIAARFNERKEPLWFPERNKTGAWHESYIKKILRNRAVLGEYQPHKNIHDESGRKSREPEGDTIEGYYPQIIDPLTFAAAAADIAQRRVSGRGRKGKTYSNLFTGLLKCGCGAGIQFVDKGAGPKGGQYLRCTASLANGPCYLKGKRYAQVEEFLLRNFEGLDLEAALGLDSSESTLVELTEQLNTATLARMAAEKRLDRVMQLFLAGDGSPARTAARALADTEAELDSLTKNIGELKLAIDTIKVTSPDAQRALLDQLIAELRTASGDAALMVRRTLSSEIKKIIKRITFISDSENIDELSSVEHGHLAELRGIEVVRIAYYSGLVHVLEIGSNRTLKLRASNQHIAMQARLKAFGT